jgi:isoleucyl-tRNA synthetase
MGSPVMKADNLNFSEDSINEIRKKVFGIWWNVFAFYKLYGDQTQPLALPTRITHVMDCWIASRITHLIQEVTKFMDEYDVVNASRVLMAFVDECSTWYLRESRDRLRDKSTNKEASQVFGYVMMTLAKLFAPIAPFFSEIIYQHMDQAKAKSIHLEDWPVADEKYLNDALEQEMSLVRQVAEKAHAVRKELKIKVRQPLASVTVVAPGKAADALSILRQEINVEEVTWAYKKDEQLTVQLDTAITEELKAKGEMREVMRVIQDLRKEANVAFDTLVDVELPSWPKEFEEEIKKKTLVKNLLKGESKKILSSN